VLAWQFKITNHPTWMHFPITQVSTLCTTNLSDYRGTQAE
jgi:hypothetical protein